MFLMFGDCEGFSHLANHWFKNIIAWYTEWIFIYYKKGREREREREKSIPRHVYLPSHLKLIQAPNGFDPRIYHPIIVPFELPSAPPKPQYRTIQASTHQSIRPWCLIHQYVYPSIRACNQPFVHASSQLCIIDVHIYIYALISCRGGLGEVLKPKN